MKIEAGNSVANLARKIAGHRFVQRLKNMRHDLKGKDNQDRRDILLAAAKRHQNAS